jgi:hypothetical protein
LAISKLHRCPLCKRLVAEMQVDGVDGSVQIAHSNQLLGEYDSDSEAVLSSETDGDPDYVP